MMHVPHNGVVYLIDTNCLRIVPMMFQNFKEIHKVAFNVFYMSLGSGSLFVLRYTDIVQIVNVHGHRVNQTHWFWSNFFCSRWGLVVYSFKFLSIFKYRSGCFSQISGLKIPGLSNLAIGTRYNKHDFENMFFLVITSVNRLLSFITDAFRCVCLTLITECI